MIREALASLARQEAVGGVLARTPVARSVVSRVVGGDDLDEVLPVAMALVDRGFHVALERVAPSVDSDEEVVEALAGYGALIDAVVDAGLAGAAEVVVFTDSLGFGPGSPDALGHLTTIATQARDGGVSLQVGSGDPSALPESLRWVRQLIDTGDDIGVTLPAILRSTEHDVREWADCRVRLVKGAHGDATGAYRQPIETDKAFVRCAKTLLRGSGQPSFATHDPRLIEIVESLARRFDRPRHSYEFAFYLGRLTGEQERLLAAGERVRVYVPYGHRWFERLVGGLAEQPSGVAGALRSLLPG